MNSKQFLIEFEYEYYYCRGYEWKWTQVLVTADSFEEAVDKIFEYPKRYYNARNFINKTLD
jgi:hypothetical protein